MSCKEDKMRKGLTYLLMILIVSSFSAVAAHCQETIFVHVWDQFGYKGMTAGAPAMEKVVNEYMKLHPNVKISRTFYDPIAMREIYLLAIKAGEEPDLAYTWPQGAVMGKLAGAGELYPMTEMAKEFGWFEKLTDLAISYCSYKGDLYAYPFEQDYFGLYYNKDLFNELGLEVPRSYEDLLKLRQKAQDAGYATLAFGNREMWEATNVLSMLFALVAGKEKEEELFFGDAKWTDSEFVEAAQTFRDWADQGFFPAGFNSLTCGERISYFSRGKALMELGGSWVIEPHFEMDFDVGVIMFPQIKKNLPQATMQGVGSGWQISADAPLKVQKEAARFLDLLDSEQFMKIWIEEGKVVPIRKKINWAQYDVPQVMKTFYEEGEKITDVSGYDLHTNLPESVTDVLYRNLQMMLGGTISVQEFLGRMQEAWEKAKAAQEIYLP